MAQSVGSGTAKEQGELDCEVLGPVCFVCPSKKCGYGFFAAEAVDGGTRQGSDHVLKMRNKQSSGSNAHSFSTAFTGQSFFPRGKFSLFQVGSREGLPKSSA